MEYAEKKKFFSKIDELPQRKRNLDESLLAEVSEGMFRIEFLVFEYGYLSSSCFFSSSLTLFSLGF